MESKRLTVGLFLADVADDFSRGICRGAMQAAEELDVNMIIFPGKYIDRNLEVFDGIQYDYQYNTLFTYANPEEIDLLVGSDICLRTSDERDFWTISTRFRSLRSHRR